MYNTNYFLMTPGPTMVQDNVLQARTQYMGNPDIDSNFFKFYEDTCNKLATILNSKNSSNIIMCGEAMLGLESACSSLTEIGDNVLVIENGVFGKGFSDLVTLYGGNVTLYSSDWKKPINSAELDLFLSKSDLSFKYATFVHCDTPSGILNDVKEITKILKKYNILSVVDSVAAMGGVSLDIDNWEVDICLGGTQKAFSAPTGLSIITVSQKAWSTIQNRKKPIIGFYTNLSLWKNCVKEKLFPYSLPSRDILGLSVALDNILEIGLENIFTKHKNAQTYTLEYLEKIGLKLYLEEGFSPTVTAFLTPKECTSIEIIEHLKTKYGVLIASSYGPLKDIVLRIGHMGENIQKENLLYTLESLKNTLIDLKKD